MPSCDSLEDQFFGTVTVGERGQVVIPAEAPRYQHWRQAARYGASTVQWRHPLWRRSHARLSQQVHERA